MPALCVTLPFLLIWNYGGFFPHQNFCIHPDARREKLANCAVTQTPLRREPCQTVRGRWEQAGDWARSHNLTTFCIVIPEWRDWETINAGNVYCMSEIVLLCGVRRPFCGRQKGLCAVSCCLPNTKHVPAEPTFLPCLLETLKRAIQEFVLDLFMNARINNAARSESRKSGPLGFSSARKEKSLETTKVKGREGSWFTRNGANEYYSGETCCINLGGEDKTNRNTDVKPNAAVSLCACVCGGGVRIQGSIILVDGTSQMLHRLEQMKASPRGENILFTKEKLSKRLNLG